MSKDSGLPDVGFGPGRKRGGTKTLVRFSDEQLEALRQTAQKRMSERKLARMDTGEVVREAVDAWAQLDKAVDLGHRIIETTLVAVPKYIEAGEFETANGLLENAVRIVAAVDELMGLASGREESSPQGDRLRSFIAKLQDELRAKSAAGGKGKKGVRK